MACKECASDYQRKFSVEMNFHFPGYEGLTKPTIWLFPEVVVCLNCGFAEFSVPQDGLQRLTQTDGASA